MIWLEENPGMTREALLNRLARSVADAAIEMENLPLLSDDRVIAGTAYQFALMAYRVAKGGK